LADPELRNRLIELGIEPFYATPEDTHRIARSDRERWSKVIREERVVID